MNKVSMSCETKGPIFSLQSRDKKRLWKELKNMLRNNGQAFKNVDENYSYTDSRSSNIGNI